MPLLAVLVFGWEEERRVDNLAGTFFSFRC